jgi:ElaB/YqjD/DUF883 family membrane-anchored ribosome-binding protein
MSNTKLQIQETKDAVENKATNLKFKLADNLSSVASTVHDRSDTVKTAADSGLDRAKDVMETGIEKANDLAHSAVAKANSLGHRTASAMENTSDYVKDLDIAEVTKELRAKVAARPEVSIAVAGVFGLAIGLLIGNRFRNR